MHTTDTSMCEQLIVPVLLISIGDFAVSAEALMTHFSHHTAIIGFKGYNSPERLLFDYDCSGAWVLSI